MSSPKNFRNGLLTKNIFRGTCRGLGTAFATLASLNLSKLWRESRCNLQVIRPCVLEPPHVSKVSEKEAAIRDGKTNQATDYMYYRQYVVLFFSCHLDKYFKISDKFAPPPTHTPFHTPVEYLLAEIKRFCQYSSLLKPIGNITHLSIPQPLFVFDDHKRSSYE